MNIRTAHSLAVLSKMVYKDPEFLEEFWNYDGFTWIESGDTQAGIFEDDEKRILVFRGTESAQDWLTDLDVHHTPWLYGNVHRGFKEAFDAVWPQIEPVGWDDKELFITGHSLGAALATLAVSRIGKGDLYTFGSPKVGDAKFVESFNKGHESIRFVNNNDIVARVPLTGYQHVGTLKYFTHKGQLWTNPNRYWVTWDRVKGRWSRKVADGVKDHSMTNYVTLINSLVD